MSNNIGIHHVQFIVGNALLSSKYYSLAFGLPIRWERNLSCKNTKERNQSEYVLECEDCRLSFKSCNQLNEKEAKNHYERLRKHGDFVHDVALDIPTNEERNEIVKRAMEYCRRKDLPFVQDHAFQIRCPYGNNWGHSLIVSGDEYFEKFEKTKSNVSAACKIEYVDHVAFAVEKGSLPLVIEWYKDVFGFKRFLCNDDDDQDFGIQIQGLRTVVLSPSGANFKFVIIEPVSRENGKKSQIQEFIDFNGGPGIAHIALNTSDIAADVKRAKQFGVNFIDVPADYYELWKSQPQWEFINEDWELLQKEGILVDGNAHKHTRKDSFGYILQTFTHPLSDRPTFYLEFINRKGSNGFGKGNISRLHDCIEKLQEKRGNL